MRKMIVNGHLGADPEVKTTRNGIGYTTFRVANSEFGDPENSAYWFTVTVWDSGLQNFCKNLKKGSYVIIDGDYSNRIYTSTKTGQPEIGNDLRACAVYFGGGSKRDEDTVPQATTPKTTTTPTSTNKTTTSTSTSVAQSVPEPATDDELPF